MAAEPLAPGVWGVVATPFTGSTQDVDAASLAKLVDHYSRIGVTGLTVLGVFGEAVRLSAAEKRAVLEVVVDSADLPIVVGASSTSTAPVIDEVALATEVVGDRLAGAMVQVNTPDPELLARQLDAVHAATGAGLVVQDYPLVTGVAISAADLAAAVERVESVVAVKAEAPPTPPAIATLTARTGVPVFGGLGGVGLLDELAAGSAGAMTGFSFPEGLKACVDAWWRGGYQAALEAYLGYLPLVNFEAQARIGLAVRKEALRRRGLISGSGVRAPASGMPETLAEQLDRHLAAVENVEN
ncbi:dihydrodipicolinate synthase family protein [Saccharopolyspora rhizosphaerae]|uniref:Dihydrodipicolinate synthase family protein n=1 Tax=Saccharopolyspora rhizosphaerae TaxID=2492662 RepID=A0A3R8P846_9PSEU|nr:dihydrodipicolinate synthase family protein [Saccharopolyspora rhizosphaerae]RRO18745.1 dihydrodipicolinate synthase family protein [Saccharopolyspora rhizosphaerae]